jgi:hypothetical protein
VLATLLLAAGAVSSCSSSPDDNCNDVSGKICDRLAECDSLDAVFTSQEQCEASFNGMFEVGSSDDEACRQTWSEAKSLECAAFLDYFSI